MHIFGIFIYIFGTFFALYVDVVYDFLLSAYSLANVIFLLVAFFVYSPLLVYSILAIKLKTLGPVQCSYIFRRHVILCASLTVSFGLIGTFLGLVDMISSISQAMDTGSGDFSTRISSLLDAISTSLGAMSYAFVTSILGICTSCFILFSAPFLESRFSSTTAKSVDAGVGLETRLTEVENSLNTFRVDRLEGKNALYSLLEMLNENITNSAKEAEKANNFYEVLTEKISHIVELNTEQLDNNKKFFMNSSKEAEKANNFYEVITEKARHIVELNTKQLDNNKEFFINSAKEAEKANNFYEVITEKARHIVELNTEQLDNNKEFFNKKEIKSQKLINKVHDISDYLTELISSNHKTQAVFGNKLSNIENFQSKLVSEFYKIKNKVKGLL